MSEERLDLTVTLDDACIAWQPLHEALEVVDEAGFVPHRFHALAERELARVEADLGTTLGVALSIGGGWLIERKTEAPAVGVPQLLGCAGYHGEGDRGIVGPFHLDGELAATRLTMLLAALFSLRERGYRRALIPGVKASALPAIRAFLGGAIVAQQASPAPTRPRVVVCASGNGSNFQAVIDAAASGNLALDIVSLVTNRRNAFALERAQRVGIASQALVWERGRETRAEFDARVIAAVASAAPDLVLLLGWMHLLPLEFVTAFPACYNIHPAYLPLDPRAERVTLPDGSSQAAFRGAHAVDDALAAGASWIGASLHAVTEDADRGRILARAPLALRPDESREQLDARLHQLEHRVLLEGLRDDYRANWTRKDAAAVSIEP